MYHILQTMNDFLLFYLVYYLDGYFSIADSLIDMIFIQTGKYGLWSVGIAALFTYLLVPLNSPGLMPNSSLKHLAK